MPLKKVKISAGPKEDDRQTHSGMAQVSDPMNSAGQEQIRRLFKLGTTAAHSAKPASIIATKPGFESRDML